jgi:hypothetical protein
MIYVSSLPEGQRLERIMKRIESGLILARTEGRSSRVCTLANRSAVVTRAWLAVRDVEWNS